MSKCASAVACAVDQSDAGISTGVKRQFIIGDFILTNAVLFHHGKEIALPPKERAVLEVLLEALGEVVPKNILLETVWGDEIASEESLSRCIYVLRRILMDRKDKRYILNVYGQGYRFSQPVSVIYSRPTEPSGCKLAVLPFRMSSGDHDMLEVHDAIIQSLSHFRPFGLTVFPASMTKSCYAASEIAALIKDMAPDFYLTGYSVIFGGMRMLRMELVRAVDHAVFHRENVDFEEEGWLISLQHKLSTLLPRYIPSLQWGTGVPQQASMNVTLAFLLGKRDLRSFTPDSLTRAAAQFRECLALDPSHVPSWCALAECYLALMLVGLIDSAQGASEARLIVEKALNLEPNNLLALAQLAWLNHLQGRDVDSGALLTQAAALAPGVAEVHYYHALYLLAGGDLRQAVKVIDTCLTIDRSCIGAIILRTWLIFCDGKVVDAIAHGVENLTLYAHRNPLLQRLVVAMQAARQQATETLGRAEEAAESNVWKACSTHLACLSFIGADVKLSAESWGLFKRLLMPHQP